MLRHTYFATCSWEGVCRRTWHLIFSAILYELDNTQLRTGRIYMMVITFFRGHKERQIACKHQTVESWNSYNHARHRRDDVFIEHLETEQEWRKSWARKDQNIVRLVSLRKVLAQQYFFRYTDCCMSAPAVDSLVDKCARSSAFPWHPCFHKRCCANGTTGLFNNIIWAVTLVFAGHKRMFGRHMFIHNTRMN